MFGYVLCSSIWKVAMFGDRTQLYRPFTFLCLLVSSFLLLFLAFLNCAKKRLRHETFLAKTTKQEVLNHFSDFLIVRNTLEENKTNKTIIFLKTNHYVL